MKLQPIVLAILTFFALTACQQKNDNKKGHTSLKTEEMISTTCDSLLLNEEIKAVSVGVIKNGKIFELHKGILPNGKTPTGSTVYEIASLTKTFTGTLLAEAISQKKVTIDDDIRDHLSGDFPNLEFEGQPITFRHLVTHTSGIPRMFPDNNLFENPDWDNLPAKINKLQSGFKKDQFFEELVKVKLDTIPGHTFAYSNAAANLLGFCLENIFDKPYEVLLSQYILDPLEMNNTSITLSDFDSKVLAVGLNHNDQEMPFRAEKDMKAEGGILASINDMIKYMKFHLNEENSVVNISHQELLNGKYGDFENGLFWQIFKNGDQPTKIFQNGGAFGTSSWLTIIPETQTGVIIITNVSGPEIHQKLNAMADSIIAQL